MYFPPVDSDEWETKSVEECGWNADAIEPLLSFLESNHTKAFMILQDGKIVIESYMNNFTSSDWWYWASAGKTLTTGVTTICQDEGYCNIDDKVSDYLGMIDRYVLTFGDEHKLYMTCREWMDEHVR